MKQLAIISILLFSSCSIYKKKYEHIGEFKNDKGGQFNIYKTKYYDRKTKVLMFEKIDTVSKNEEFITTFNMELY